MVCVAGPAGIGKTRLAGEAVALAAASWGRGVFSFLRVARQRRPLSSPWRRCCARGTELANSTTRRRAAQVRARIPDAPDEDVLLLYDLMGIRDPDTAAPTIHPDARRRRLTALINSMSLARTRPGRSTSSRMRTGSMRSASRCWPSSSPSFPGRRRWC